ncbi:MAG TPA: hypothetical protein VKP67_24735 [Xanthobacteraceae bacterium]|nr:hypothetical protein [Xanthobacteraceae bacterium]
MESAACEHSDDSPRRRATNEVVHLIRKLRWIGMEDEAKIMAARLAADRVLPGDNVIGGPTDTD